MTLYFVWVAIGVVCAFVARRWQGDVTGLDPRQDAGVLLLAIGGSILGAYGLQLPADLLGWNAPVPAGTMLPDGLPLMGRTVLGGILGGWIAVELGKRAFGIEKPTGDGFALPLAIALGFGRIGCIAAGCCVGRECAPHTWAYIDAAGRAHVPVQAIEVVFHFTAAVCLWIAVRRGVCAGNRLALYVAAYALVRFVLEFERVNPVVALGLTWHQFLALALFALAGGTAWKRGFVLRPCAVPPRAL